MPVVIATVKAAPAQPDQSTRWARRSVRPAIDLAGGDDCRAESLISKEEDEDTSSIVALGQVSRKHQEITLAYQGSRQARASTRDSHQQSASDLQAEQFDMAWGVAMADQSMRPITLRILGAYSETKFDL